MSQDITPNYPIIPSATLPGGVLDVSTDSSIPTPSGTMVSPPKDVSVGGMQPSPTALTQGSGNDIIKISSKGIHLGDALFETAPFSVDMQGNLKATSATISGNITALTGNIAGFIISGTSLSAGTGVTTIGLDTTSGIYLGASTFASAPFSVSLAGVLKAQSGTIGGTTITATELYGGIIKTAATVAAGSNGVIMDSAGLRGYDSVLGKVFDIHTDGSAPEFAFGNISNSIFEINTNAILRTSPTVGDGSASSAGILINDTGLYATEANQTLANANVKILIDGSAVIKMNVKGGQTDFATGNGYFLGLSGGDYKFSVGDDDNYLRWDGAHMIIKGAFDVGNAGIINNAVYTVANLPIAPTSTSFLVPSAYE